jgi:hypothetical protein
LKVLESREDQILRRHFRVHRAYNTDPCLRCLWTPDSDMAPQDHHATSSYLSKDLPELALKGDLRCHCSHTTLSPPLDPGLPCLLF